MSRTAPTSPGTSIPEIDLTSVSMNGIKALDDYLNNKKFPSIEFRAEIFQEIARRKTDATLRKDYKKGEILSTAEKELHEYFRKVRFDSFSTIMNSSKSDIYDIRKRLQILNDEFDHKIQEVKQSFANQRQQMDQRHKKEREDFIQKWKDPKSLLEFSKPSPHLLQIRELERRKALANDFRGASEMKKQGDAIEKKETAAAQKRAQKAMEINGEQLMKQQLKEEDMLTENERVRLEEIETKRSVTVQPLVSMIKREDEIMSLAPKLRERERPSGTASSCCTARYRTFLASSIDDKDIATPRTFRRQVEYRNSSLARQLPVSELDPDQFFKIKEREESKLVSTNGTRTEIFDV